MPPESVYEQNWAKCYATDNNFAYAKDLFDETGDAKYKQLLLRDVKLFNFVPTYDQWCLYCGCKSAAERCSGCHAAYFCDRVCQKRAWRVHKRHCGRPLFARCCTCGTATLPSAPVRCPSCPVVWCSESCAETLRSAHQEFDCAYFGRIRWR